MIIAFYMYTTSPISTAPHIVPCTYCRTRQTLIVSRLWNKIHSITTCAMCGNRILLSNSLDEYETVSGSVRCRRVWKTGGELDRQNSIQSSTAKFFEITTSVSFHECEGAHPPSSPAHVAYLMGKGDRSI